MTRDEAIGRIKARFDKWALDDEDMKAIQTLIPELAESEDERVIKTIRQLLETARDAHSNTSLAKPFIDALAWLEKQKEQKPVHTAKEMWNEMRLEVYAQASGNRHEPNCSDNSTKMFSLYDIDEIFEKIGNTAVGSQPTEWGDEDSDNLERVDNYLWMLDNYVGDDCAMPQGKTDKIRGNIQGILSPWLKALPERFNLQPKQEWSEDTIRKAVKEAGLTQHQIDWFKNNVFPPKPEWSEEDEEKIVTISEIIEHCTTIPYSGGTLTLNKEYKKELLCFIKSLRPQYHGDVTMTEAYKMGLEAGKASSWKPSEEQTNNVIVELTRIELGDIINGLYYLKEKYYEDCKEHNGTATMGLSDEFKFYFKRFNETLDLYTRLHELEKERYGTTTDGYYYE